MREDHDWCAGYEANARLRGDQDRLRLCHLVHHADLHRETDPDQMLHILTEGRNLARQLREQWWELFYEDRRAGALMKYKGDARQGLELAVRNMLEARKPAFDLFPWRFRIHDHLVVGYLNSDPVGYATEITEALDWMQQGVPLEGSPRYLVLARKRWLAGELNDLDTAESLARQGLAMAASDPDQGTAQSHAVFCFSHLAQMAWQRGHWDELAACVLAGEELARRIGTRLELGEFLMWQAVLARRDGSQEAALRLWRQATARIAQIGMPPDHIYFDALTAYHEEGGEMDQCLEARDRELGLLVGTGRLGAEMRCRCVRLELLARIGRPLQPDLDEAKHATAALRKPAFYLEHLDRIERGIR